MRTLLGVLVVVIGAGIPTPLPAQVDSIVETKWDSLQSHLPLQHRAAAIALEDFREQWGLPVTLWRRVDLEPEVYSSLQWFEHPCGTVARPFIQQIPLADSVLLGEAVVEFDAQGSTIKQWIVPVDAFVLGVTGDELLIRYSNRSEGTQIALAIRPDGAFRVASVEQPRRPSRTDCPVIQMFEGSAYLRCRLFVDLLTGVIRRIAFEGPCT